MLYSNVNQWNMYLIDMATAQPMKVVPMVLLSAEESGILE